mmetsp:Transcript_29983/g.52624  ORF Transcript_29983/g.52624 Transcript_29983/m.52624 type:complete len:214 (-) Transcript_29983:384-1025(-)
MSKTIRSAFTLTRLSATSDWEQDFRSQSEEELSTWTPLSLSSHSSRWYLDSASSESKPSLCLEESGLFILQKEAARFIDNTPRPRIPRLSLRSAPWLTPKLRVSSDSDRRLRGLTTAFDSRDSRRYSRDSRDSDERVVVVAVVVVCVLGVFGAKTSNKRDFNFRPFSLDSKLKTRVELFSMLLLSVSVSVLPVAVTESCDCGCFWAILRTRKG